MKILPNPVRKVNAHVLGLDIHKVMIAWVLFDRRGAAVRGGQIPATREALAGLVEEAVGRKQAHAAFEASGCSLWAFDLLVARLGGREFVHVAHAKRVRAIANSQHKTDHNDAWWLGYLTYEGRLPEVYVPTGDVRELRTATRHRAAVVQERTRTIKRMRAHVRQVGLGRDLRLGALATEMGRAEMARLAEEVGGMTGVAIREDLEALEGLDTRIAAWEERIEAISVRLPDVGAIRRTIPGMGKILAATVVAETGPIQRFHSPKALARHAGLTPCERTSGGRQRLGAITKEGSRSLRWALCHAVMCALRCRQGPGLHLAHWVRGTQQRLGSKKKGQVAGARKMAEAIWRLRMMGEVFDFRKPFGPLPQSLRAEGRLG
jgi:transposase